MNKESKTWLVRTRVGEIMGPFSQRELLEELQKKSFTPQDEIAPSLGYWISAQTLLNRDSDEFTRTSTRNTAITRSTESNVGPPPTSQPLGPGPLSLEEDSTPTADYLVRPPAEPPIRRVMTTPLPQRQSLKLVPLVLGASVVVGLWILASHLKPTKPLPDKPADTARGTDKPILPAAGGTDGSPFVRDIYRMIQSGQTATALNKLTSYHEKLAGPDELEYLIPYAALLITEQVSPARARKLLEKVLNSPKATKDLRARAHHWMGYLMLSSDDRDMGESHFLDTLQLNPRDPAARFNLGRAYVKQGRYRQAIDYLNQAELEAPNLWLVQIYRGRAKAALNLMDEAGQAFRKAVMLSKDRWISYMYHALFLMKREDNDGAQKLMRMMLTRDPNYEVNSPPPFGFYQERVNYAEYLNTFSHIMSNIPGEERELGKLYISYLLNGPNSDEARRIAAVAEKGGLMAKVFALKVVLDGESNPAEIKRALARLPNQLTEFGYYAYVLRGEARMRIGDLDGAQNDFVLALQLEPQSAISQFAYATLLKRTGQDSKAREKISGLLAGHPNFIPAIVFSQNF